MALFLKKRLLSLAKSNLFYHNKIVIVHLCHNLVLLTFLSFDPSYRRNNSGCLEVRVSVYFTKKLRQILSVTMLVKRGPADGLFRC